jgi:hypothetical protein
MKTSTNQARNSRPTISKTVMALAVASVMGGMAMTPALAEDNDNRQGHQDQGLHKGQSNGDRDRRDEYRREPQPVYQPVYQPSYYYYSQPVYAPPPVYYEPQASPGISLFFPLNFN